MGDNSMIFEKRPGATDRGRDYEHLYMAILILKLLTNDAVEDFYMSSNDKKYGSFDDVVLEVKYSNKEPEIYAVQLKQSKNKVVKTTDLEAPKGNFSIEKYLEDYNCNLQQLDPPIRMILFTNCSQQIENVPPLTVNDLQLQIETDNPNYLLAIHSRGFCFKFCEKNSKHKNFFDNFFLYFSQGNVNYMTKIGLNIFENYFASDVSVFKEYMNFLTTWSLKEGKKEKLNKKWMQQVITLIIVSPFLKPLSFTKNVNILEKVSIISHTICKFDLTYFLKGNFVKIKNLWENVIEDFEDFTDLNKIKLKYQLQLDYIEDKDSLYGENKELNKLLWLMKKCPLVIDSDKKCLDAVSLLNQKKFIVLTSEEVHFCHEPRVFKTLYDLKVVDIDSYDKIVNIFMYSLEGQEEMPLKHLVQQNTCLSNMISADNIIHMINAPLYIGKPREILPPCHIYRSLSRIYISLEFPRAVSNVCIIISELTKNFNKFSATFSDVDIVEFEKNENKFFNITKTTIFVTRNEFDQDDFTTWCNKYNLHNCHQLKFMDNYFEWVRSLENFEILRKFRVDHEFVNDRLCESQLCKTNENTINIVCASSGMGKTTLMKSLKISSSSSIWTIIIYVKNFVVYLRKNGADLEGFIQHILNYNCEYYSDFDKKIYKNLIDQNKFRLIWDGVDEVSAESLKIIINIMKHIATKGVKQWITARSNRQHHLENTLRTFCRRILQFNGEEQREYIKNRLNFSNNEIFELFRKIQKNVEPFLNNGILGIPLQIYMLTELFHQNKEKYVELLNHSFTILDLYKNFVEVKFLIYFLEKMNVDLTIEANYNNFKNFMFKKIELYKNIAYNLHFPNKKVLTDSIDEFLAKIKSDGDIVGLVNQINDDTLEFIHNLFGEYFSALFLFDNNPIVAKNKKFIQNVDYNNIRFFLDLMLTKDFKAHVAVLYKNSTILDECTQEELDSKDTINRSVLELSCAWTSNVELAKIQKVDVGKYILQSKFIKDENTTKLHYPLILKYFFKIDTKTEVHIKKILLLLPFLIPLYSKKVDGEECSALMIYYSVIFDHVIILKYLETTEWLKRAYQGFKPKYLISIALIHQSHNCLQAFLIKKHYQATLQENLDLLLRTCYFEANDLFFLLGQHFVDTSKLVFYACNEGYLENVEYLIEKGVKLSILDINNRSCLHYACDNEVDGFNIAEYLIFNGGNVNSRDEFKRTPLHYACMNETYALKIVVLLTGNEADVNVLDCYNRTPLHYACDNEQYGFHVSQFLICAGAIKNITDCKGLTPIHYACVNWKYGSEIVKLFTKEDMKIQDQKRRIPLHYACKNYFRGFSIIEFMLDNEIPTNIPDDLYRLPLHYVCETGTWKSAELLIHKTNEIEYTDKYGQCALHFASRNYSHGLYITRLLLEHELDVDILDCDNRSSLSFACEYGKLDTVQFLLKNNAQVNQCDLFGRFPIHYACMNLYHSFEITTLLINHGSKIDGCDNKQCLPIHFACQKGTFSTVMSLLNRNRLLSHIPDKKGKMPIHYACENFNYGCEIVNLLLSDENNINVTDSVGRQPIHYACISGQIFFVKLFISIGAELKCKDALGKLPVDYANDYNYFNIVTLLENI